MGENIQRMLKFPESTVTAYTDPVKGLADALAKPPDLLLLDMRMPRMSGEEVFARLHEAHPGLPIVFLTAFGSVERDRKSTRLNSSHLGISYAVFCLKKK